MKKIRILVIEDNRVLRDGITLKINEQKDMHVVAVVGSGDDVLLKTKSTKPHVILLDVGSKQINEPSLIDSMQRANPDVKVIAMGLLPDRNDIIKFVEAGSSGFILKNSSVKVILATIRSVAQGDKILPPSMTGSLFSHVVDLARKTRKGPLAPIARMSKREREIMGLIADGLSNKEIGTKLNIATHTAKSHIHNIMEKLALHSRLQIAKYTHDEQL